MHDQLKVRVEEEKRPVGIYLQVHNTQFQMIDEAEELVKQK